MYPLEEESQFTFALVYYTNTDYGLKAGKECKDLKPARYQGA